jgi:DUF1009 family protein
MVEKGDRIGLIAGGGQFPILIAKAAQSKGMGVFAVAHQGETDPLLEEYVGGIKWIKLGQLGQMINALKNNGVHDAIMAGTITKKKMFGRVMPDLKGLALISKLAVFHDDDILRAVAGELEKNGITVMASTNFLPDLVAPPGCLTRRKPTKAETEDLQFGWKIAKSLGELDIGQCVVVRRKTVLALEAIEGTDETIRRGGSLAGENAVVVKVCKPHQDLRFDMPSVGIETIKTMDLVKAAVLAVEAGKTLIFDRSEMVSLANEKGISIFSKEGE